MGSERAIPIPWFLDPPEPQRGCLCATVGDAVRPEGLELHASSPYLLEDAVCVMVAATGSWRIKIGIAHHVICVSPFFIAASCRGNVQLSWKCVLALESTPWLIIYDMYCYLPFAGFSAEVQFLSIKPQCGEITSPSIVCGQR